MNYEYVYIFTNPAMPEWVKVGKSNNIPRRLDDLNCTAVPLPFECFACLKVPAENVFNVEKGLQTFLGFTFQKEKEFFRTTPEKVLQYFETAILLNPNYELIKAETLDNEVERTKASTTTFSMLKIPVGTRLEYTKDSKIFCEVADNTNKVIYENETYSISGLACKLRGYSVNGFTCFMFEDETLWNRRQRLHPEL